MARSDLLHALRPQENGSLLLARDFADVAALGHRAEALSRRGVAAEALSARQLRALEPQLALPDGGAALLVAGDAQLVRSRGEPILDFKTLGSWITFYGYFCIVRLR